MQPENRHHGAVLRWPQHPRQNQRRLSCRPTRGSSLLGIRCSGVRSRVPRGCRHLSIALPYAFGFSKYIILHYRIDGPESVPPSYFFPFFVGSTVVRDANFKDLASAFGHLRYKLGLHSKPIFFDAKRLDDFTPEYFVTRFHVRKIQVREHVRQESEKPVSDHVPKINHAVRLASEKTRTENYIGAMFENRR